MKTIVSFRSAFLAVFAAAVAFGGVAHAEDAPAKPVAASQATYLVVSHKVQNFDTWKVAFDSTAALKKTFGWRQSTVYAVDGDRNNVTVIEEFSSLDGAKAFSQLADLRAAMKKGGVVGVPEIHFVAAVATAKN